MIQIEQQLQGHWLVRGRLTKQTVTDALRQTRPMLEADDSQTIDLRFVERIDSAGLAYLVELLRLFDLKGTALHITHIPQRMAPVAKVYGLDRILPAEDFVSDNTGQHTPEAL